MAGNNARAVRQLRRLATAQDNDAALLDRFRAESDADAFAELVRRHGPMVLGVCRRVLGNGADADDAFQAVFLVLSRKGGSIRAGRPVANWLFGVARFAALRLRNKERRRREHETNAPRESPEGPVPDPELLAALDEELSRLPDRYRAPLIACFLQGRTQEDAARDLGCSLSTLRRRLDQGRELLRCRLAGRGAVPALAALAVGTSTADVPATMIETTVRMAGAFVNGNGGAVPATVLAEGVATTMSQTKLKLLVAAVLVAVGLAGTGIAWQLAPAQQPEPDRGVQPPAVKAPPKATEPPAKAAPPALTDTIKPGDRLTIRGDNLFEAAPLDQIYEVEMSGKINLGPRYGGRVKIDGMTLEEAEGVLNKQIQMYAKVGVVSLTRYIEPPDTLEARVRQLEKEVKELRETVEGLNRKKR
ncbi:sigma-70 family RNA polymerase sigma factor [Frigoriglobus tundricola]|uniref:ECF RNA polymerase sigma factor SigE n=1 Tax=Frigoriglobus tundricola TaxID=2774151 RepID=A0A6M5YFW2_9BACT|nr:sigma-70 family RNA polymerase sigma factor [Frigoriglobus tundricola]QJW92917.1 hypothetical protein FTUN_0414 [Frigoriglobus tundricola]